MAQLIVGEKPEAIDLHTFFAVQAKLEGWDHIPQIHIEMLNFLLDEENWNDGVGVMQVFRNAAKSTLAAIWIVWKLTVNPKLIFLIQSADDNLAQKMISDCQKIIRVHPFAAHLRGKELTWGAKAFNVRGGRGGRNHSVSARGILSNITGSRCDYLINDDIEVLKNVSSDDLRDRLRARVSEASHLLNPGGIRLFIGTPHHYISLYSELIEGGATSIKIPIIEETTGAFPQMQGKPTWPERWPMSSVLKKQKACKSKNEFYSQYLLIAASLEDSVLDPAMAKVYDTELDIVSSNNTVLVRLDKTVMVSGATFWDVSLGRVKGDASVVAIVYGDAHGNIYIHRTIPVTGEIDDQCKQVRDIAIKYNLAAVHIETNGIGNFVPDVLLKYVRGFGISVEGQYTSKNKVESIIEAYEVPLSGGFLFISRQVHNSLWASQLRDFNPRHHKSKDDFIDAPAKAIHLLPSYIGRGIINAAGDFKPWRPQGEIIDIPLEGFTY